MNFETKIKRLLMTPLASWLFVALILAGTFVMLVLLRQNRAHNFAETQRQSQLRDAAIADRAKFSANMMEVLFSDAQTALTSALNAVPRDGTLAFLDRWREVNPLVSAAVLVNARGTTEPGEYWPPELLNEYRAPILTPALKDWLAKTPWLSGAVAEKTMQADADETTHSGHASAAVPAGITLEQLRETLRAAAERAPWHMRENASAVGDNTIPATGNVGSLPHGDDYAKVESWPERRRRLGIAFTERTGWDGEPGGLFAWRMCDDDLVLIVSVDLGELEKMLAAALPAKTQNDEGFRLLTNGDRAAENFICDVPIHRELLPEWRIRAIRNMSGAATPSPAESVYAAASFAVTLAAALAILLLLGFLRRLRENETIAAITDYASHEMRTDVQEILCCTDPDALFANANAGNVVDEKRGVHIAPQHASIIYNASRRLSETVAFVLDFFPRIMRGGKIWTETVNLCQVTERLLEEFKVGLQTTGIKMDFRTNLPATPVCIIANETAVSIILRNLIDNACLHGTVAKRVVDVSLAEIAETGLVEMRVRDYGRGVPRGEHERIFKPRWHPKSDEERGHGIGLPLSRKLARSLGGDLVCEAPTDGAAGSIFILSLSNTK